MISPDIIIIHNSSYNWESTRTIPPRQRFRSLNQAISFNQLLSFSQHGGTNITTFRLVDINSAEVKSVINNIVRSEINRGSKYNFGEGNLDTNTALIYDGVMLFALALHELNMIQVG